MGPRIAGHLRRACTAVADDARKDRRTGRPVAYAGPGQADRRRGARAPSAPDRSRAPAAEL